MKLNQLLEHTYMVGGFTTRSDIARENAELIAEAQARGLIWTLTPRDGFGSVWRLTPAGLTQVQFLWPNLEDMEKPADATTH